MLFHNSAPKDYYSDDLRCEDARTHATEICTCARESNILKHKTERDGNRPSQETTEIAETSTQISNREAYA